MTYPQSQPDSGRLGRFGHHPDPAIDFCIEVEELEGMACNRRIGFDQEPTLDARVERAMYFRVGGDLGAINAKATLREIEASIRPMTDVRKTDAGVSLLALADKLEKIELRLLHGDQHDRNDANEIGLAVHALRAAPARCDADSREVVALREWKSAILSKCKASDGFDALQWGGDKEGWGFVHYFIGHLETRALHAETVLAEQASHLPVTDEAGREELRGLLDILDVSVPADGLLKGKLMLAIGHVGSQMCWTPQNSYEHAVINLLGCKLRDLRAALSDQPQ